MSRAKILSRVWTTSAAAALIFAVGTWIILEDRLTWIVGDDVILAEMLMERAGASDWTNAPLTRTYWTSLRTQTNGVEVVWGGYEWVAVSNIPAAAGADFNRTYYYEGRRRTLLQANTRVVPDRGFVDVYTSGVRRLVDMGPSGGAAYNGYFGTSTRMVPVGGWALIPDFFLVAPLFLPRHFHLESGRFLRPVNASFGAQLASVTMSTMVSLYDPAVITIITGPVASNRATYWQPREVYFATNEIMQLGWTHDFWVDASNNLTGTDPRIVYIPQSGAAMLQGVNGWINREPGTRFFCDASHSTNGTSDFTGWTNSVLPALAANAGLASNLAVWAASVNKPTRSLAAYRALGEAMLDHTTLQVESTCTGGVERNIADNWAVPAWSDADQSGWTNWVWRRYWSRVATNATFAGAVADLRDDPGWALQAETNFPLASAVWYDLAVDDYGPGLRLRYEYAQGQPFGFTGSGHNINGYSDATAHGWLASWYITGAEIPDGETVVVKPQGQLFCIERVTSAIDPATHVFASRVPSYIDAPPASFFAHITNAVPGSGAGYEVGRPVVAARPRFDVFDYR